VKSIHLIIAVLALSLLSMVTSYLGLFAGLSFETMRLIGLTEVGANVAVAIYGAVVFHRIAWSIYLVLSVVGLVLLGAATPIVAVWSALKLL
jgi:hypothetical protein